MRRPFATVVLLAAFAVSAISHAQARRLQQAIELQQQDPEAPIKPQQFLTPKPPTAISTIVPGRFVVLYRESLSSAATHPVARNWFDHLGIAVEQTPPGTDDSITFARLAAQPGVLAVLRDRIVTAHTLTVASARQTGPPTGSPVLRDIDPDAFYATPQGWAIRQAGGYGANIPGGPTVGPWNSGMGAAVRIAVLDSGVDATHPDILPNLALNISEVDQAALPSVCDDGTPQDQQGHGTWTASLAAGALGPRTGGIIGVAPQATLLNIKVLERMPSSTAPGDLAAQCNAGQAGGLLSWVLRGINDAIEAHADIISVSLGSLIDLNTGDGAGWKTAFDRVTHAAVNAGVVIIAAVGNDGLNLSNNLIELPAQARDVLPVVASTNPDCAENLAPNAACVPGPITRPYYSNYGVTGAIAAPGGSYPNVSESGVSGWVRGACSNGKPNTTTGPPATANTSFGCFNLGHTSYMQAMGTSASAALAAGAAALLRAAHPSWTAAQTVAALRSAAQFTHAVPDAVLDLPGALAMP